MSADYDKLGIKTEVIARPNSGIFSSSEPFSESERKALTALMRDTYHQFLDKAVEGRKKAGKTFTRDELDKYAEGRVWTGRQAKKHGLVDELGTLEDAIAEAKTLGKLEGDPELLILPRSKSFIEAFVDKTDTKMPKFSAASLLKGMPEMAGHLRTVDGLLRLRGEPVWVVMPYRLEVR